MAFIKFACSYCNRPLKGNDTLRGKTLRCPACKNQITVPPSSSQSESFELHAADEALSYPHKSSSGSMVKRQWGRSRPIEESTGSFPVEGRVSPSPPQSGAERKIFSFSKDPTSLTKFLKIMLWVLTALYVVGIFSDFAQLSLISSPNIPTDKAQSNDLRQNAIGIVQLAAYIITGITFLMWIHRANVNCRGLGAKDIKFTPGWAVGYYFIPILNLYKPYYAMKEIWQASQNPVNWQGSPAGSLLGLWWILWLVSNFVGQASFRMSMRAESLDSIKSATVVAIASDLVEIPLCIVAVFLVATIYSFQKKLVEQGEKGAPSATPW
jgi:hypothetical protein